jgi:N-acetylneuraminic acid mutarotase
MKNLLVALVVILPLQVFSQTKPAKISTADTAWQIISVNGEPEKREDCAFAEVDGKFYLIGGRGIKHVAVFDPATATWTQNAATPVEMNHAQAVTYKGEIYIVGAMNGGFPHEKPFENIYIYNPKTDTWRQGAEIPKDRRRGSGGTIVYNNKIYLLCGIQDGHYEGTVAWVDVFDPATGSWEKLADAPRGRDHFHATVVSDKIYLTGGRRTSFKTKQLGDFTIAEVDVYDLKKRTWQTLPQAMNLPTVRAGSTNVAHGNKLIVLGGESNDQEKSHVEVEVFDTKKQVWTTLPKLVTGRHDTQAIIFKNSIYIAAGSANKGGGPDQSSIEVLKLK